MKKSVMFALAAATVALFALPAVASATPAHINATSTFTLKGGTKMASLTGGSTFHCGSVAGSGAFTSTTGGNITLTFGGTCGTTVFGFPVHCNSAGSSGGHIITTTLPFDLVMLAPGKPGILVTGNNNHVASYTCAGINQNLGGNGILATITSPGCGVASTTATAVFKSKGHGVQEHTTYTGSKYSFTKGGENLAMDMTTTITFPLGRTIACT